MISLNDLYETESELIAAICRDERFTSKIRDQAVRMVRQRFSTERRISEAQQRLGIEDEHAEAR